MKAALALICLLLPLIATRAEAANAWNERDLTWAASVGCADGTSTGCDVTGYKLEAAGNCAPTKWNALTTVGKVTNYHAANLAAGTYCFRVIATSANGDSGPSPITDKSRTTVTAPATCPPQPASETRAQACTAPLIGNWSQTRAPLAVDPPACWAMGAWTPDTAPDGVCATAPPPPPLVTTGTYAYCVTGTIAKPTMTSIGYTTAGKSCGPATKTVGSVKFCQIPLEQADKVIFCNGDQTLSKGAWARAVP